MTTSPLQSLLSGTPLPIPPAYNPTWTLDKYQQEMVDYNRKLLDYIRKLIQQLTGKNIINELIVSSGGAAGHIADIRYDTTSKQLQVKRVQTNGTISDWTIITGGQAVEYP